MLTIRCVLACRNSEGAPDLFPAIVDCTQEQYDNGEHYEAVESSASEAGYEEPYLCFDENDKKNLIALFDWENPDLERLELS